MKNIISYIILITVLFTGCSKDLVEKPQSDISPNQFFTTEAQCIQGVNGVYSGLNDLFGQEDLWKSIEEGTDLVMYVPTNDANQEYTINAAAPGNIYPVWRKCYNAIANANLVINRLGKAPIGTTIKNRLTGEAKYLRALHYYILTNSFGDVPMWTDELEVDEVSKLPRTPLADVRKQIAKDLKEAADFLPPSYTGNDVGRATKGAALGLLAKVYLFEKDWPNAQKYAQMVVDDGQYQLVNYADLFDVKNRFKNNKESIFEIQFKRDEASNTNVKVNYYYTWFMPFKDSNNKTYAGVDFGTTVLRGYENFYPSAVFISMFENGDKRKDIILANGYNGQTFTRFLKPNRPWFGAKFWDLQANDRNSGKNLYFMRYSDVLLILAEAMNEQSNPLALSYINKVRFEHGGLDPITGSPSQLDIKDLIVKERAIEFVGEFQRKWDLMRWGKLVSAVKSVIADNPKGAANISERNNLFPIPEAEIAKDPNLLPQNTGF